MPKRFSLGRRLTGVVRGRCPHCQEAAIFHTMTKMNEHCLHCGIKFEREGGFFMMSVYIAYAIYFVVLGPLSIAMVFWGVPAGSYWILAALTLFLLPFVFRYARIIWITIDEWLDPRPAQLDGESQS